ncbi:MAG: hypothetical protein Tsb0020_15780 [Haliangiales bacterium]
MQPVAATAHAISKLGIVTVTIRRLLPIFALLLRLNPPVVTQPKAATFRPLRAQRASERRAVISRESARAGMHRAAADRMAAAHSRRDAP